MPKALRPRTIQTPSAAEARKIALRASEAEGVRALVWRSASRGS